MLLVHVLHVFTLVNLFLYLWEWTKEFSDSSEPNICYVRVFDQGTRTRGRFDGSAYQFLDCSYYDWIVTRFQCFRHVWQ